MGWDQKSTIKLANDKALILSGVLTDAFEALYHVNILYILLFYNQLWNSRVNFDEWHKGQVVPVPTKRYTSDPTKWIGVTLMYIRNNIYSSIMCGRLFKIINKHGVKYQFGYTPGVGCHERTFKIKTLLHLIHNHNLPTWVEFADLIKAHNTSNHVLLIAILGKYGAPPRLFSAIKCMYKKIVVKIIIGNIDTTIEFKVGFKQG